MTDPRPASDWSRKSDTPMRRRAAAVGQHTRSLLRENWYRDVWLFVITIIIALTITSALHTSDQANSASQRAAKLAIAIQEQRHDSVLANCRAQNARHDATIKALAVAEGEQSKQAPRELVQLFTLVGVRVSSDAAKLLAPYEARQANSDFTSTKLLIDALVPHQDCAQIVARAIGEPSRRSGPRRSS